MERSIANRYADGMSNAYQTRKQNLLDLLKTFGTNRLFADSCDLAPAHVSQMKTGKRDMGDNVARRIERALSLDYGWMDQPHESAPRTDDSQSPNQGPNIPSISPNKARHDPPTYKTIDKYVLLNVLDAIDETPGMPPRTNRQQAGLVAYLYSESMHRTRNDIQAHIKALLSQPIHEIFDEQGELNAGTGAREQIMGELFNETRNPGRRAEDKDGRRPCTEHYWDLHNNQVNIYIIPSEATADTVRELVGSASGANDWGKA